MKHLYRMETHRVSELKEKALIKGVKTFGGIIFIFVILSLLSDEGLSNDRYFTPIIFVGIFIIWIIIRAIALYFFTYSIENTIIEIDGDTITRSGEGLVTNSLKFSEIGKIKKNSVGLLLLKKGVWLVGGKYGTNYSTERDLVYIPCTIEKYDELESIINKNCQ